MLVCALLAAALTCSAPMADGTGKKAEYTNPVLYSDYSDPDVIRVGEDYWMTASSFTSYPGLQILHSTDLVNWEIVNAAVPRLEPAEDFDKPSHGNGIWAPAIRYHDGKYWIFWGDPDHGIFQVHAEDPRGEWSAPHLIMAAKGIIDTCPLWDDDGKTYLVHGWAGSRAGFKSVLSVCEMDRECTRITGEHVLVFDGKTNGNETVEGPKFYKKDGWYYIFAPSGGVKTGWQLVLRSKSPYGPYEWRNVMHEGTSGIHGPHQGGWVTDTAGDSWFLHFEDRYAWGRVCHLEPVSWTEDGWCIIGEDPDGDGIGQPVLKYRTPAGKSGTGTGVSAMETATGFTGTAIPLNWQWEANPKYFWAMPNPSEGCLRMQCVKHPEGWKSLRDTPNILCEKVTGPETDFSAKLVFRPSYPGDRCGVILTGEDYSTMEMVYDGEKTVLRRVTSLLEDGNLEKASDALTVEGGPYFTLHVKVKIYGDCMVRFSYSLDGKKYRQLGEEFKAKAGKWIGAKLGFFATAEIMKNDGGTVDIY